jgi:hypothetical protein
MLERKRQEITSVFYSFCCGIIVLFFFFFCFESNFIMRLVHSALNMKPPSTIPAVFPSAASRASTAAPQTGIIVLCFFASRTHWCHE